MYNLEWFLGNSLKYIGRIKLRMPGLIPKWKFIYWFHSLSLSFRFKIKPTDAYEYISYLKNIRSEFKFLKQSDLKKLFVSEFIIFIIY